MSELDDIHDMIMMEIDKRKFEQKLIASMTPIDSDNLVIFSLTPTCDCNYMPNEVNLCPKCGKPFIREKQ